MIASKYQCECGGQMTEKCYGCERGHVVKVYPEDPEVKRARELQTLVNHQFRKFLDLQNRSWDDFVEEVERIQKEYREALEAEEEKSKPASTSPSFSPDKPRPDGCPGEFITANLNCLGCHAFGGDHCLYEYDTYPCPNVFDENHPSCRRCEPKTSEFLGCERIPRTCGRRGFDALRCMHCKHNVFRHGKGQGCGLEVQ